MSEKTKTVSPHDIRFLSRESAEKLWVIRRRCERYWEMVRRYRAGEAFPAWGHKSLYGDSEPDKWADEDTLQPEADVDWLLAIIDELIILHQSREQRLADSEHKRRELERGRP